MSGRMSINGPAEGPPFRIPIPITDLGAGLNGAIGILAALAALAARERTGLGQHVDTSLFESGLSLSVSARERRREPDHAVVLVRACIGDRDSQFPRSASRTGHDVAG